MDRLLRSLDLRRYYCGDCGWQTIGRVKRQQNQNGAPGRSLGWRYALVALFVLAVTYAVSALVIHLVGGSLPKEAAVVSAGANRTAPDASVSQRPATEDARAIQVIGNRDSKLYHLPGMKYYDRVEAYHRVSFASEEEAVAAGYRKAPR